MSQVSFRQAQGTDGRDFDVSGSTELAERLSGTLVKVRHFLINTTLKYIKLIKILILLKYLCNFPDSLYRRFREKLL